MKQYKTRSAHTSSSAASRITLSKSIQQYSTPPTSSKMVHPIPITTPTRVFEDRTHTIHAVAHVPYSQRMVSASEDGRVRLWDLKTAQVLKKMEGHTGEVMGLGVSRDGQMIVTSDEHGELIAWQAKTGESLTKAIKAHGSAVRSLDFSPDDALIVTASSAANDQKVKFWNTKTWAQYPRNYNCGSTVRCVRYARSGTHMLAVATDQDIQIYLGEKLQKKFKGHTHGTLSLAWSPDKTYLLSGGDDHDPTIREWDTSNWTQVGIPWTGHTYKVNSIAINSSGTHAVSASSDNSVRLWQLSDKQTVAIFHHTSSVVCATFSADGAHILSGGYDKKITEWAAPGGILPADHWVNEKVPQPAPKVIGYNSLKSSDVKPLQPVTIITGHDSKLQQAVLTTASHDSKLQEAVWATASHDLKSQEAVSTTASHDSKLQQAVSATTSHDFKSREAVSTTASHDSKSREAVSMTAGHDFKSQQAISTTAGHDYKFQQAVSTTAGSDSKSLQSSSIVQSVLSEQSVSKAGQSVSKSELSAAKSATILEKSVTKSELAVSKGLAITTTELLAITKRTASITGDLTIAEKVLTEEITADAKNFASYANRSFVMARKLEWNRALQDANKSLAVQTSLAGYVAKGIALCGQQHIEDARMTFDLGFTLTEGNMDATWILCLIKAIALFNANRHEEAMLRVDKLSNSVDPLTYGVVVASLRIQLGTMALRASYHSEAIEHFSVAVKAITFLAQSAAPAVCEAFTVVRLM
ncbi:WD40 repeat-like protein [Suillus decipiens]|nr:WD40 repeat-like protein [Suillus decipiens]